jgi:hypothetical protein
VENERKIRKLIHTDDFEHRTILFAIDHENIIQATSVILLNSFLKKDSKEYRKQLKKANHILNNLEHGTKF